MQRDIRQPTKADIRRLARDMRAEIPGLLDMRAAIEPKATELATLRATDEAIDNLRWLAERATRVPQSELRQADSTLHIAIAHAAQSDRLLDLVLEEQMRLHELLAYLSLARGLGEAQHYSAHQHGEIVDAIALRDPHLAYHAMRDHIEATNNLLRDLLDLRLPGDDRRVTLREETTAHS